MKEISIVRENLMTEPNYSPYCGNNVSRNERGGCDNPRTKFNGYQFVCPRCRWVSEFPDDFIERKRVNPYISGYYSDMSEYSYLIHDGNHYKIGKSKNPIGRLKQIKTGNPSANLVRFSNLVTEKYLHSLFCTKRINGEWFNLCQSDVDYVLELMDITNIDLINAIVSCSIVRILETKSTLPTKRRTPLKMKFGKYKGRDIDSLRSPEEIDYLKWWHSQTRNRDNKTDIDLEISNHLMKTVEGFKL